jgi:hexosaminidase
MSNLVPEPVSVQPDSSASYQITASTVIYADQTQIGDYLAGILDPSTGFTLPVEQASGTPSAGVSLLLSGAPSTVGAQGYTLDVTDSGIVIRAEQPAGLFAGVQTLRQLLPPQIEAKTVQPGPWTVPGGSILDYPRLAYRGAMLDVSRHFFTVAQVEQYIDQLSLYKINYLHLHLSDDEGWRIAINGWPNLASVGASTEAGGGSGGYYTQAQYQQIVAYAASRYVTIVPEIDMPGHFTAALASYGELNCDGTAPPVDMSTGTLSNSICTTATIAKTFIDNVISQLAALTPGPYISIGGDEAQGVSASDYASFMTWAQQDVDKYGKTAIGWDSILNSTVAPSTVAEYWGATSASAVAAAANNGTQLIMAPASVAYMDQKYNSSTVIGLAWAAYIDMKKAYGWDPATYLSGVPASAILGIEAPVWTETADTLADVDYLAFPRITAYAELGWSPESVTTASGAFTGFASRVAAQGPRWDVLGITYYHSTQIPWTADLTGPTGPTASGIAGKCLDVRSGQSVNLQPVQLYTCNGTAAQTWSVDSNGTIEALGKCLDVYQGGTASGTKVELYTCESGDGAQQWQWSSNGTYGESLTNPQSGLCLDDPGATSTNGTQLQIYTCNGTIAQVWRLP